MIVSELIERFLKHCARKGLRPATLRHYRSQLNSLSRAFSDRPWTDLTREDLLDWLHESCKGLKNATERARKVTVGLLQDYAQEFHDVPAKLTSKDLKKPPVGLRERIASAEETAQILNHAPAAEWSLAYRFLRLTGCRPIELVSAQIEDLQESGGVRLLVITQHKTSRKTGRPRKIPIGAQIVPLVDHARSGRSEGPLFLDDRGNPWTVAKLSRNFRTIRNRLGFPKDLVLYCTRHEFGSAATKKHGIFAASKLLGHTDVQTTQRYAHITDEELLKFQEGAIEDIPPSRGENHKAA